MKTAARPSPGSAASSRLHPSHPLHGVNLKARKRGLRLRMSALWQRLAPQLSAQDADRQMEKVRAIMLVHLGPGRPMTSSLCRRIQYANDIQGLWYLRSDLMTTLAAAHGETMARMEMTDITSAFAGALPREMKSRAGPDQDLS
ncbi:MAG: hypothetical protein ABIP46_10670 [Polaromonas sp.]